MPKVPPQLDVLVLGQHPCAYLAAELLRVGKPGLNVAHASIPGEHAPDRLVLLNPGFFALHKPLEKLKRKLELTPVCGVSFLGEQPETRGEWRSKSTAAYIGCYSEIRRHLASLARDSGARLLAPKTLKVTGGDETCLEVLADAAALRPRAVLLCGAMAREQAKPLGLPDPFNIEVMRRYSFLRLRGEKWADPGPKPIVPMSLDLAGKLTWAWMLPGQGEVQLAIEQPLAEIESHPPAGLMEKWGAVLRRHGFLRGTDPLPLDRLIGMDMPAAGALTREIVANRTLLFGPAGGFFSASLEDLYPNCWSATFAADAIRAALQAPHLQDALQPYRQEWGTTLGEYLRGPQQNLRFLLPLVYRNPVMASRMAESILLGKSVVR